ncbi:alpha-mannosidase [Vallitalea sp.]|jgi:alpha-mannosidase|uniref:alpha-mannosidase n=1 Tax=Vallitalea sp. TaxID=1882829 RepID=UPI0025D81AA2|nr:alpha-mannosidase [Vallitalea sp.]MCT4687610.1 alpha-mannosidase [Vallitalea sp.]
MFFEIERIGKLLEELKELRYVKKYTFENIQMKEGFYKERCEADESANLWKAFNKDDRWGGKDKYAWFRGEFEVTEEYANKKLVFQVLTGKEGGWDANNPQFIIFVNGKLVQGLDINHTEIVLTNQAVAGEKFVIDLQAYSGTIDSLSECRNVVSIFDDTVEKLYYDIYVPLEVIKLLPKENKDRIDTIKFLTNAVNKIDLRKPYNKEFYTSINDALDYLEDKYYHEFCGDKSVVVKCVGHTHIDVAWLWDLDQTRLKVQRSFSTVLELMNHYDDYIFMSSQPQLYKFLKEDRPDLYEQIKERIKEGRWEPEGAMWVEADCNLSSGESLVRQVVYGKQFFRNEFGVENKILWLPDVFGYSAALPQILKKSSVDYFMTTKISWNEYNKLPYDTFEWEGLDGSKVLTHFITTTNFDDLPERFFTTYNGYIDPKSVKGAWERYQQKDLSDEVLISYGYGDGGGGPTKDMLEISKRLEKGVKGCPAVKLTTATDFFETLDENVSDNNKLPRWVGELYFEYHRGTLTSMARNKRYNRKSEFLYEGIEWLSSMANLIDGVPYPKEDIYNGWEIICLNQFHDIIPGSSIKKVYDDSKEQYEEIIAKGNEIKDSSIDAITKNIDIDEESVVVFNPLSFDRAEIIDFEYPEEICVYDGDDKLLTTYNNGTISFYANIPGKGYKTFSIRKEANESSNELIADKAHLANEFYDIRLDDKGHIISLLDKRVNRQVLKEGERGNVLQAFEDKPHNWDAWDINIYYQEKMWEIDDVESIEVVEKSSLKATLEIKRNFLDSTITQLMTIYHNVPRIDFDTTIDWKEKHILVKAAFPVDIHTDKATYDIQFGNVERPTHWNTSWDTAKFEVCGHKWADLSEDNYGISLLNDCKYGHDIKNGNIRLTLLKSATVPNEDADREVHNFKYSLYPHIGDWKDGGTVKKAYEVNVPVHTCIVDSNAGTMPKELSFVKIDSENVIAEVVKLGEYSDDIIVRVHECYNRRTNAKITFFKDLKEVVECDLEERKVLNNIETANGEFQFEIKPYEIKTFKLILK